MYMYINYHLLQIGQGLEPSVLQTFHLLTTHLGPTSQQYEKINIPLYFGP